MNFSGFCRRRFLYLTLKRPSNGLYDLCNKSEAKTNHGFELRDLKNLPMDCFRTFPTLVSRPPKLPLFWGLFFIDNFFFESVWIFLTSDLDAARKNAYRRVDLVKSNDNFFFVCL